jgi:hypothetical protein
MATGTRMKAAAVCAVAVGMLGTSVGPVGADPTLTTVAEGLITPLGFDVSTNGTIYVGEAFAGRLTAIGRDGERTTLVDAAPASIAGVAVNGNDVSFTTTIFPEMGAAAATTLSRVTPSGRVTELADLQHFEETHNPDGEAIYGFLDEVPEDCEVPDELPTTPYTGIVESNPYAVAIDGSDRLVADAAGNSIVRVRRNGSVSLVAVLPPVVQEISDFGAAFSGLPDCVVGLRYAGEPVPTDVEVGPDGHYYVTSLPGFPEELGAASVWRIHRSTGAVTLVADGLSFAVDLAISRDGTIYVAELLADPATFTGRISTISGGTVSTFVDQVPFPGAIEIQRHGNRETIYATIDVLNDEVGGSLVTIAP